jgi:predicted RNase H-like nuclease
MAARASAQIAGVDGCKSGWIAVIFQPDAFGPAEVMVFDTFANLVGWLQPDSIIAVDMPIGLPERAIKGGRAPDWAAKEFLGPRRASVFLVPSRRAVYAREAVDAYKQGYRRVCAVARETSDPRRAPSI